MNKNKDLKLNTIGKSWVDAIFRVNLENNRKSHNSIINIKILIA